MPHMTLNNAQRLCFYLLLSGSLFSSAYTHATQVYKYRDNDGVIQFDHRPPEGKDYEVIEQPLSVSTPDDTPISSTEQKETPTGDDSYDSQLDGLEVERMKACQSAQENKRTLLSVVRVSIRQLDGTEKLLTKEEKLEKLKAMDKAIRDYCPIDDKS